MIILKRRLKKLRQQEKKILKQINERNKYKEIECSECGLYHKIKNLIVIQTHREYNSLDSGFSGCREGELQFICPETGVINRLLFNNNDVPWGERGDYANNPEEQFKRNYKDLFEKFIDNYDKTTLDKWVNNFYVDKNREKFGLVEKRK